MNFNNTNFVSGESYSGDGTSTFTRDSLNTNPGLAVELYTESKKETIPSEYIKYINFTFSFKRVIKLYKHSIGSGDIVDYVTSITGIKKFIIYITKGNCGCEARRKKFNKILTISYYTITFTKFSYIDEIVNGYKEEAVKIKSKQKYVDQISAEHMEGHISLFKPKPAFVEQTKKSGCGCANKKR
jgi:hypothetical protein